MSQDALFTIVGRVQLDPAFGNALAADLQGALTSAGYPLEPHEVPQLLAILGGIDPEEARFQKEKGREWQTAQLTRAKNLSEYTVNILKTTLGNATNTYKRITLMTTLLFMVGLALFVTGPVVSLATDQDVVGIATGGLGAATFVALFLSKPIKQTQTALSDLVQVEIVFMDFFEQITLWEGYALRPEGIPPLPNPKNIEKASEELQKLSRDTVKLLQQYTEVDAANG